jgi:hypothetical protein
MHVNLIKMLRYTIGDYSSDKKYSDDELNSLLALAAGQVLQDIDTNNINYDVNPISSEMTPDPIEIGDTSMSNFVVLKAACISDEWEARYKAISEGILASCQKATMSTKSNKAIKLLLEEGPCYVYENLKMEYYIGNVGVISTIFSPFVSNEFQPM